MGKHGPRRGSLAFWHRKRASRLVPRMRYAGDVASVRPTAFPAGLGSFAGYKVGMADAVVIDQSNSPSKGQEVVRPVTVVEVPPLFIYAVNVYTKTPLGLKQLTQICATNVPKEARRALTPAKKAGKIEEVEKRIGEISQLRVIALTQPVKSGVGKKKPEIVEIALGGKVDEQLATAKNILGKEVKASEVLKEGQAIDVIGVTQGKGWQGVVKRFGVALNPRKATAHRRKGGSIGPETQAKVFYSVPRPGQMGFHRRTDANKKIWKISSTPSELPTFAHYGKVKADYIMIDGSIPGPEKRIVRIAPRVGKIGAAPNITTVQFAPN